MKLKKIMPAVAAVLLATMMFQSCIGSFSLTNKVLAWNRNVSNKFVNELVFFAFWVLPVYEVTAVADLLVVNSIEFWSGNRPLESNNQVIKTDDGNYYIQADATGYKVTSPNGDILNFDFDMDSQTWSFSKNEGEKTDFLKFKGNNHVEILNGEGIFVDVELSRGGVDGYIAGSAMQMMALNR